MAFQDFANLSARRRVERKEKQKKWIIAGSVLAVIVVLLLIAGGVFALVHFKLIKPKNSESEKPRTTQNFNVLDALCSAADYKKECRDALSTVVKSNSSSFSVPNPKGIIKAVIAATAKEITEAFNLTSEFKIDGEKEQSALEVCKKVMEDAVDELGRSVANTDPSKIPDLRTWLSAVLSYAETCVDAFPEGKSRTQMEKTLKMAREFTSNSLAVISELGKVFSTVLKAAGKRSLLESDGLPSWMSKEHRRMMAEQRPKETPNVVVAKDGSGNFATITEALSSIPLKHDGRFIIYVKEGVYDETVIVTKKMRNVTMYGDGSQKTIITGNKNKVDGVQTYHSAPFIAEGDGFIGKSMGFRNTAGPEKEQAVAARVNSDRAIFLNCRFEAYQDTLYAHSHRQFYRSCVIVGTVDFIFGDAAAVFQNCLITVRKPGPGQQNIVTAQGRTDKHENTGIVLHKCRIVADQSLEPVKSQFRSYLGRPWKEFSRTIIMESEITDVIQPDGYLPWEGEKYLNTLYYAEFNNKGSLAAINTRVKWPGYKGVIGKQEAMSYTVGPFLGGDWIKKVGIPVQFGLFA